LDRQFERNSRQVTGIHEKYKAYHLVITNESFFRSDIVAGTTGSIERSVQIPKLAEETNDDIGTTKRSRLKIPSDPSSNVSYGMRDLYHRQQRLAYWINYNNN